MLKRINAQKGWARFPNLCPTGKAGKYLTQSGIFRPKTWSLSPHILSQSERHETELGHFVPLLTQLEALHGKSAGRSGDRDGGSDTLPPGATQGTKEFFHRVQTCDTLFWADVSVNLGHGKAGVAELFLNQSKRIGRLVEYRCVGMPGVM